MRSHLKHLAIAAIVSLAMAHVQLHGQASVGLFISPHTQFFDANGVPLSGGCVYSYSAGTVTPQATYSDFTGVVTNSNPTILDSGGYANIWLDQTKSYKFKAVSNGGVNCASGTSQWTVDNIPGSGTSGHVFAGDGTCASTGIGFISESITGFIRPASGTIDFCLAGTDVLKATATALSPTTAGAMDLGTVTKPYGNIFIGAVGTNNGKITGTFSQQSVFTLPDFASGTFELVAAAQSPTNKTFKVDTNTFVDPADVTKVLKFSLSGMTTAKTLTLAGICTANCTITFPDATDTVALVAASQNLLAKTLTSPTITGPTFNTSMNQGSAFKFQNFATGPPCSTSGAAGATCTNSYTWTVAFADSNYVMGCSGLGQANTATGPTIEVITASGFTVRVSSIAATVASFSSYNCWAWHP